MTVTATAFGVLGATELPWPLVAAIIVPVVAITVVLLVRRPRIVTLRRGFIAVSIVGAGALAVLGVVNFRAFQEATEEDHLLEWLTAGLLAVACGVCVTATIRLSRMGRPSPLAALLSTGFFLGFWRELEWGQPFFGVKLWYSRNMFQLRSFVDPSYFEEFSRKLKLPPGPMYECHLILSAIMILLSAATLAYLIRHRRRLVPEVRRLARMPHGRYFILGVLVYGLSQALGRVFERVVVQGWLWRLRENLHLSHRIFDEPLETWASLCFLMAAVTLWQVKRCYLPADLRTKHRARIAGA